MGSVTTSEFPIDAVDASLNVVEGKVITWDRLTQVCLRTADGKLAIGQSFGRTDEKNDARVGFEIARRNAVRRLKVLNGTLPPFERATVQRRPRVPA